MELFLTAGSSPHIKAPDTTQTIMRDVLIALLPTSVAGIIFFGLRALMVIAVSVIAAVVTEFVYTRLMKLPMTIMDLSAAVTGLLLALSLSPLVPWWMAAIGAVFAIVVAKMIFGGLGQNFVNPALAARAMMLASWPSQMATFMNPRPATDLVASATPLPAFRYGAGEVPTLFESLIGRSSGSIGEVSVIALLIGLAWLLYRRIITLDTPLAYLVSFAFFAWLWGQDGLFTGNVLFHVLNGGFLMAAIFMVSDYTTTPMTRLGRIIFGAGAGFLTMAIRAVGGYPEGVTYAILIMNCCVPLIDRAIVPPAFGGPKRRRKEADHA
ncbi:MAG: RnfABCDGE type electron transport complex subunit D [Bacillota bacterium]|nr:RnfABCDGE type electron transport complex subunit D [Bacillota bacterium]